MSSAFDAITTLMGTGNPLNCFPWDLQLRRVQISVSAFFAVVLYYINVGDLTCAANAKSVEAYINSYCGSAIWYHDKMINDSSINNSVKEDNHRIPADEDIRNFNWFYFTLPTIAVVFLIYFLNGTPTTKLYVQTAREIMKNGKESGGDDEEPCIDLAWKTTPDSERKGIMRDFVSRCLVHAKPAHLCGTNIPVEFLTSILYYTYIVMFIVINIIASLIFHPDRKAFREVISCQYVLPNKTTEWTNCVVPGIDLTITSLWIMMALYIINILSCFFSWGVLAILPSIVLNEAEKKISLYADDVEHEANLRDFLHRNRGWLRSDNNTKYILLMIFFHVGDAASWLAVACMDVLKDEKLFIISKEIKGLFRIKVARKLIENECVSSAYRTVISDISMIEESHRGGGSKYSGCDYKDGVGNGHMVIEIKKSCKAKNEEAQRSPLKWRLKHVDNEIPTSLNEEWYKMFSKDFEYSRNFFQLYKLSSRMKTERLFEEIEYQPYKNAPGNALVTDNSHVVGYDARNLFIKKRQHCWRSMSNTDRGEGAISIVIKWESSHVIMLLAIQGPHYPTNMAGPSKFRVTFNDITHGGEVTDDKLVSIDYTVDEWLADEWKVFTLCATHAHTHGDDLENCLTGSSIKLTMLDNSGADFYEIQKIKLFGKLVCDRNGL